MNTFDQLPAGSRVWIYQSDREFTGEETELLRKVFAGFLQDWNAHKKMLTAAIELIHNRFIVVMVDESNTAASGCSIDKSVHLMKEVENRLNVNLFNRLDIAYRDGNEIRTFRKGDLAKLASEGKITPDTIVFNNLVQTKTELESIWETPLKNTWLARFIPVNS